MVQRQAVTELVTRRNLIVAALYSNPTWDEEENDRPGKIRNLENSFNRAIEAIYHPELIEKDKRQQEIDWDDPFWSASRRNLDRLKAAPRIDAGDATVEEVMKAESEFEQRIKRADEMIKKVDQLAPTK